MYMKINKYLGFDMFGYKNEIVQNDLRRVVNESLPWNNLNGKSCLVTGANGMIATYIVYFLMYLNREHDINVHVIALSRSRTKSEELFGDFLKDLCFELMIQDICEPITYAGNIDYIFHFAGNSSPYCIKNDPVGIMKSNLVGTINVLELARMKDVKKVLLASTREVYGENNEEDSLMESSFGHLDCLDARSCYPESKRAAETLCESYHLQYGVPFNTARIAHAYGPGMRLKNDGRVMADLLNYVIHNQNIILKSTGEAKRAFCYVSDVLSGLMYILFKGKDGEAYNLANEKEEITIKDLAETLVQISTDKNLRIVYDIPNKRSMIYCNYKRVRLNTIKLEKLDWKPSISLQKGIKKLLGTIK